MPKIVNNTTFPSIFDLLAPHSCRGCGRLGSALCNRCKNYIIHNHQNLCPVCKSPNPTGKCPSCPDQPPTFVAGKRDEILGTLIQDLKYHSNRSLAHPLAEILHGILPTPSTNVIVVPLPTISRHIRNRGLDHTRLIGKKFCQIRGKSYQMPPVLLRAQNTVQVGADRATRQAQAKKAYRLAPGFTPQPNTTYLLLDDVYTTGASLRSAHELLKKAGASQIAIAVLALSE